MRGEINLDLADVDPGGGFGLGGVASNGSDVELVRSNENVEYGLAEGACGLYIQGIRDRRRA